MGNSASLAGYSRKFLLRDIHIRQDNCTSLISEGFSPEAFFLALPTLSTGAAIGIGILLVLFYFAWMLNATYLLKRYIHENVLLKLIQRYQSAPGSRSPSRRLWDFSLWTLYFMFAPSTRGRPIEYANLVALMTGFFILAGVATLFPQAVYWLYSRKLKITARLVYGNLQSLCNTNTVYRFFNNEQ
ncbi:hypothetical protein CC80DRAFT_227252 [Byssothecium circinans]|uniref:Uncharacterized protein n=1 Tax=Byssothecium circinans TaxID=147558 RepID=A0A6A5TNZ6_9PLEO|nr:hypothetical protein CC80DRAFT_227252 [Byssothecium circinans]